MPTIINFLEKMGQNAEYRYANPEQLAQLMADADPLLIEAVVSGDQQALELILGARTNVVCGVHPADQPDEDDPEKPEEQPEQENIRLLIAG